MDYTTRLGLNKPDPDPVTGDVVDISKLNENADEIDAAISFTVCTSTGRPSSPFPGQAILETDTGESYLWGGSAWIKIHTGNQITVLNIGVGGVATTGLRKIHAFSAGTCGGNSQVILWQSGPAAGSRALATRGGTDTNDHWWVDFDGNMQWGPGNAGADTDLYRDGIAALRTGSNFSANSYRINGNAARVMTDFEEASASSNLALVSGSFVDVPGCSVTVTTRKSGALLEVHWVTDFDLTNVGGGAGLVAHSICNVGGSDQGPNAVYEPGNVTAGRATLGNFHSMTLGAAGTYVVKQRAKMATGASGIQATQAHTRILAKVFE